ncbi:MAG: TRAM domain-containing protein [Micrococcales bacterium]|nr:TRAM domain-containing protein [Micrococcales bacterium]MCL2668065.1 TRAM domain-containing protein [Micrococcales bacterium]
MSGQVVELEVGAPAHGGHCVARLDGRVVFVRHALPGERVRAQVTGTGSRFWRADAVEVLEPSDDRVASVWPAAGPGGVGGGELAHASLDAQRRWKAQVLAEQLRRLAHDDRPVDVLGAPGDDERGGLAYRTRLDLVTDDEGRAGMFGWHSHEVHPLDTMPLAVEAIADLGLFDRTWPAQARIVAAAGADDQPVVLVDDDVWDLRRHCADRRPTARRAVREQVGRDIYRVAADGFWQAHRCAPGLLVDAVLAGAGDVDGAVVADLYAGAGLFTVPLAAAVGPTGEVVAVEGDTRAVRDARRNVHHLPQVSLLEADVRDSDFVHADVVVLDPPRAGARQVVVDAVAAGRPDRVVYVACDPAALARDIALFAAHGYVLDGLSAYDVFPMTHHVETVAVLVRA